jgi:hypothetical protein
MLPSTNKERGLFGSTVLLQPRIIYKALMWFWIITFGGFILNKWFFVLKRWQVYLLSRRFIYLRRQALHIIFNAWPVLACCQNSLDHFAIPLELLGPFVIKVILVGIYLVYCCCKLCKEVRSLFVLLLVLILVFLVFHRISQSSFVNLLNGRSIVNGNVHAHVEKSQICILFHFYLRLCWGLPALNLLLKVLCYHFRWRGAQFFCLLLFNVDLGSELSHLFFKSWHLFNYSIP